MTEEDYKELDHITNRLRSMVDYGTISEELMVRWIKHHVKLNPEATINRVFNQVKESKETTARPMEIPNAVKQLWEAQKQQVDYLFYANDDKEDLKEPEEEPERKRTVLGMIFPFRL